MEKYSEKEYRELSKEEKSRIFDLIFDSIFVQKEEIDNITYIKLLKPGTGQQLLLEDTIMEEAEKLINESLQEYLDKKDVNRALGLINIVFRLFFSEERIKEILANADIELLKGMYVRFHQEIKKRNINIFDFIDSEKLYEELINTMMKLRLQNANENSVGLYMVATSELRNSLDTEVEQQGGIGKWIGIKGKNKKIGNKEYRKDYLVGKVLSKATPEEERTEYIKLLIEQGFCTKDLIVLIEMGEIEPVHVARMYNIQGLRRFVIESMGKIQFHNAIMVFAELGDLNVLSRVSWNKARWEQLKDIRETDNTIGDAAIARVMIYISERGENVSKKDIDYVFQDIETNKPDAMRAWFELVKRGLYNEEKIITLHGEKVNNDNLENPYQYIVEDVVTITELLSFFNTDRVISKMKEYCNSDKENEDAKQLDLEKSEFLNFYLGLLEAHKITQSDATEQIIQELTLKLQAGIATGEKSYLLIAIQLFEKRIIDIRNMQQILNEENQEVLIELYDNGIDDNTLLQLYKLGFVEEYIIELLYQEIDEEQLKNKTNNRDISIEDAVMLYFLGVIEIENLGNEKLDAVDWEQILKNTNVPDLKGKISALYKNGNIGFEEVKGLKELGVIGAKEAEAILNQLDLESILMSGLTSEEGNGEQGKRRGIGGSRRREGIPLEDRDVLLTNLGFEPTVNVYGQVLVVAKGSFAGYRVYRDTSREFGVIIFENETEGSSFIMHEAKAGEFICVEGLGATLVGSRSQWREKARTEGSVTAKLHTVYWGRNVINAIVDTSSTFKFDDEQERKQYVKTQSQKLCEENQDTIEYIKMVKQEQLAK